MGNKFCICHESEKHGQTSVMCCNSCGLPDEDFWQPPSEQPRSTVGELDELLKKCKEAREYLESIPGEYYDGQRSVYDVIIDDIEETITTKTN